MTTVSTTSTNGPTLTSPASDSTEDVTAAAPDLAAAGQPFRALLAVVGELTSDGRMFDRLTWREPPLTLYSQLVNSEGHRDAPVVGRIDRIVSEGPEVWGYGVIDAEDEHAVKTVRFIRERYLRGVSVDAAQDVAFDVVVDDDGIRHYAGEIGALTIVGFPAFRETQIELLDETPSLPPEVVTAEAETSDAEPTLFAVSGATNLPLAPRDRAWDGAAAERRVRAWAGADEAPNARYARAFFIVDGARDQFGSYHLGFADVIDGTLMAVPRGIIAAAGAVQGSRGASNPAFQAAKPRIAGYYRRMEMDPPWEAAVEVLDGFGLVASARPILPASAFRRPEMTARESFHVDDDGRVWGHIYGWGECHLGSAPGRCVQPPPSSTDYAYFLTGSVLTDEGEVAVGQIAISTDHAPLDLGWTRARDHYANTALVAADVACGEDEFGIWVAGMVRLGASPEVLHALHASKKVSGDWRPVGRGLELVAILTVNMAGYPRLAARFEGDRILGLVASMPMDAGDCGCGGTAALADVFARLEAVESDLESYRVAARAERASVIRALEVELGLDRQSVLAALDAELGFVQEVAP